MRGLRGVNLQRAYGTPYFTMNRRGAGLGDDSSTTVLDPSVISSGGIITNPSGYPGLPTSVPATPPNWLQAVQLGVQDAFSFTKLLNPVPPGTVMMTGPNGQTYVARASDGSAVPSVPGGLNFGTGSSLLPLLLIGGLALLVLGRGR